MSEALAAWPRAFAKSTAGTFSRPIDADYDALRGRFVFVQLRAAAELVTDVAIAQLWEARCVICPRWSPKTILHVESIMRRDDGQYRIKLREWLQYLEPVELRPATANEVLAL